MIFGNQPNDPWTSYDFKLLEAYQICLDETCPECSQPMWLCHSNSNRIEWAIHESTCHATRARIAHNDNKKPMKERAKGKDKSDWGVTLSAVPRVPKVFDDQTLPTRREFYEELAESRA